MQIPTYVISLNKVVHKYRVKKGATLTKLQKASTLIGLIDRPPSLIIILVIIILIIIIIILIHSLKTFESKKF